MEVRFIFVPAMVLPCHFLTGTGGGAKPQECDESAFSNTCHHPRRILSSIFSISSKFFRDFESRVFRRLQTDTESNAEEIRIRHRLKSGLVQGNQSNNDHAVTGSSTETLTLRAVRISEAVTRMKSSDSRSFSALPCQSLM